MGVHYWVCYVRAQEKQVKKAKKEENMHRPEHTQTPYLRLIY